MYPTILGKTEELYFIFVPETIRLRRNINQQKQPDFVIIAPIIWGIMLGFLRSVSIKLFVTFFI